ncbi:Vacuolar protein sorting-associated protein 11-like protein [Carpediemonas membranifera]|uniref:Vacuolar protein sorting-associated protein 11-like protein n=1 Tax=Carpediemonas membranifera TaxID=201153 RepID=A0A8J6BXQ9_9EUKA|nr:Vacuolar protein sorting-associated protein 11-like protein [Carpediemonas membranifera]|eukprot:KAG9393741.1 Vacuolar protein sorting-associated protein 11-like protein [Carpediemonas membranifera]
MFGIEGYAAAEPSAIYTYYRPDFFYPTPTDQGHFIVSSFKGCFVLVSPDIANVSELGEREDMEHFEEVMPATQMVTLTVVDHTEKIITFQHTHNCGIIDVVADGNSLYTLTADGNVHCVTEIDTQRKLEGLYAKNQYATAIKLASNEGRDEDYISSIRRDYADYLWLKGDPENAVNYYKQTIGHGVEPSYVIDKLLNSSNVQWLTDYLKALHRVGLHTSHHTRLLLNCFTKKRGKHGADPADSGVDELRSFIFGSGRGKALDLTTLDVESIIVYCHNRGTVKAIETASRIANMAGRLDWVTRIQVGDHQLTQAVETMTKVVSWETLFELIQEHAAVLLEDKQASSDLNDLIVRHCRKKTVSLTIEDSDNLDYATSHSIHSVFPLYINHPALLTDLLTEIVKLDACPVDVWTTLFELKMTTWAELDKDPEADPKAKAAVESDLLGYLDQPESGPDRQRALVTCHIHQFRRGILHLSRHLSEIVRYHIASGNIPEAVLEFNKFSGDETVTPVDRQTVARTLLPHVAKYSAEHAGEKGPSLLAQYLDQMESVMTPLEVVDALAQTDCLLCDLGAYLIEKMKAQESIIAENTEEIRKLETDIDKVSEDVRLCKGVRVYRSQECDSCHKQLTGQIVHFSCGHSYHADCLTADDRCYKCSGEMAALNKEQEVMRKKIVDFMGFDKKLQNDPSPFSVVAEYFGSSIFSEMELEPPQPYVDGEDDL